MLKQLVKSSHTIVKNDKAVPRIVAGSPNPVAAVAADRVRQTVLTAKEVDSSCLAIVLGKDAAIMALVRAKLVPRHGGFVDHLLPAELVGVPLRQAPMWPCS